MRKLGINKLMFWVNVNGRAIYVHINWCIKIDCHNCQLKENQS